EVTVDVTPGPPEAVTVLVTVVVTPPLPVVLLPVVGGNPSSNTTPGAVAIPARPKLPYAAFDGAAGKTTTVFPLVSEPMAGLVVDVAPIKVEPRSLPVLS